MHGTSEEFDPEGYQQERLEPFDLGAVGYPAAESSTTDGSVASGAMCSGDSSGRSLVAGRAKRSWTVRSGTGLYVAEWLGAGASMTGSDLTRVYVDRLADAFPRATEVIVCRKRTA